MKRATSKTMPPMSRPERERHYRQWAAKIVAELPSDDEGSRRVLQLAECMRREWLVDQPVRKAARKGGAR